MKFMFALICTLSLTVSANAAVHTFERATEAIKNQNVDKHLLIYKVKDSKTELGKQQWRSAIAKNGAQTSRLFRRASQFADQPGAAELNQYFVRQYKSDLSDKEAAAEVAEIFADANTEFAYFEPNYRDAVFTEPTKIQAQTQATLGNYQDQQFHLAPAPIGVDAIFGWSQAGGTGKGIRIIDVETGCHPEHLEFNPLFYANPFNAKKDHGTAVWGEVAAKPDGLGITGIAYDVEWGFAGNNFQSWEQYPVTMTGILEHVVANLNVGDMIIIEQHAPLVDDFGPIEYFEPLFKVLQLATSKGIHCIAAAGNGYSNLDDAKYNGTFDLKIRDSGCVLVGAAYPPTNKAQVHQRADFSNFGSRVDAFGYGHDVVTTGYGDLYNGVVGEKLATYTSDFSGTSSATPIVAGAVASVLGMAKAKGVTITPSEMRAALRATGSAQKGNTGERIGNLPDIKQLSAHLGL